MMRSLITGMFAPRTGRGPGKMWRFSFFGVLAALCFALSSGPIQAQLGGKGSINGTVTDPSGAAVSGAAVTAVNVATGVKTTRPTTSSGYYVLSPMDPGSYTVTVDATGFKTLTQDKVTVNALQVVGLNLHLEVGTAQQTVVVSSAPPPLDTANATLGGTIENEAYTSLPLEMNGGARNPTQFVYLMPGVSQGNSGSSGIFNGTGSVGRIDELYIDGVPLTRVSLAGDPRNVSASLSVDAIDQFQVVTGGAPIEYQGAGVQNYVIRSGTNVIHGTLFDYFRNTALDTWGWGAPAVINPATGKPTKPIERQNEFGGWLGGPILKNRVFLFLDYDGFRYNKVPNPTVGTLPTILERGGNFSDLPAGQNIYDPTTTTTSGGVTSRQQFSYNGTLNAFNPNRISPLSAALVMGLPLPTNPTAVTNNWLGSYPSNSFNWKVAGKIDAVLTNNQRMAAVYSADRSYPYGYSPEGIPLPLPWVSGQVATPSTKNIVVEHTWTPTTRLVNQLKWAFIRYDDHVGNAGYDPAYGAVTAYGIQGLPGGQTAETYPNISFAGPNAVSGFADNAKADVEVTNTYDLLDNVQYLRGKHSLTFGVLHQWLQDNYSAYVSGNSPFLLGYSNAQTGGYNSSGTLQTSTGDSYASFLLGQVNSGSFSQAAFPTSYGRIHPWSIYGQDDYAVTPRLTVNIGLRWDYFPPFFEKLNRISFLNPTLTNPAVGIPGALQFGGNGTDGCDCRSPINEWYKNFGPRVGLAYGLDPKTVLRAAYTVNFTHGTGAQNIGRQGTGSLGYTASPSVTSASNSGIAAFILDQGFPAYQLPPFISASYGTGYSTTISTAPASPSYGDPYVGSRAPYAINWNVGLERELMPNLTINVNYVGSQAHFLPTSSGNARGIYSDQLNPIYYNLGSLLSASATPANIAAAQKIDPSVKLPYATFGGSSSATIGQMLRPFPQYSGVSDTYGNIANSNYNALQLSLNKRMSNGLQFMLNYTYSREIDDQGSYRSGYQPTYLSRGLGTLETPQILAVTEVYNLPFGAGHALGAGNPVTRAVVQGWQISSIYTYSSGNPISITASGCNAPFAGTCIPSYAPNYPENGRINGSYGKGALAGQTSPAYLDKAAFVEPAAYTFGNLPVTAPFGLRGPGTYDIDMSLKRTFQIYERFKLLFDISAFNVTNKVLFGISSTAFDSSTFGQVSGQTNNSRDIQLAARINW